MLTFCSLRETHYSVVISNCLIFHRVCAGQSKNDTSNLVLTADDEMEAELQILKALVDRNYEMNLERYRRNPLGEARTTTFRVRNICSLVHQQFHNLTQYSLQMLGLIMAFSNTVVNPIIYAVLYPQFRTQLTNLHRRLRSLCRQS